MDLEPHIRISRQDIEKAFDGLPTRVLTLADVRRVFNEQRQFWRIPTTATADEFLQTMLATLPLEQVTLEFPHRSKVRYTWREIRLLDVLQSLDVAAYFCHYTAIHLHGLTEQIPKTIYLNVEQKMRGGGGTLSQGAMARAFQRPCRTSNNFVEHEGYRIYVLNGGNTGRLGVVDLASSESDGSVRITDVERTLIDATVRPIYSGEVHEIAKAFQNARGQLSVNKLVAYLRKLNYTYPYHQAIGYYLQRAGYKRTQLDLLRQFDMPYDFYLTYQMSETEFVSDWRLHIPKGF